MSNYKYSGDLVDAALFQAGEKDDNTSEFYAVAIRYLNRAYQALWAGGAELDSAVNEEWLWLLSTTPGTITLVPVINSTAIVANNSASITFASGPAVSVAGYFIRFTNNFDVYRIAAHTAGATAATLDSVYTGTNASAETFKLFKAEYDLPANVLRLISPMRQYRERDGKIDGMDLTALEAKYPLVNIQTGVPRAFAQIGQSKVRFSHAGSDVTATDYIRVDFDYLQKPSDETLTDSESQELLVPHQWRHILSDFATFWLMVDKNDNRADSFGLIARNGLKAMARENRMRWAKIGRETGRIFSRQDELPESIDVLRTSGGVIIG